MEDQRPWIVISENNPYVAFRCPSARDILASKSEKEQRLCWSIETRDGYSAIIQPFCGAWSIEFAYPSGGGCGAGRQTKIGAWLYAHRHIRRHRKGYDD